ncbi:DUF2326 domain-containing protein [Clostridium sporogenes]|uniref:DUF2326 domain-containing protein n=1 Tax=Clostridium sporogenes TaxID=1509 RepID=UPI0022385DBB|nr:DUF2326 domain-containing protein [Clostridium sporogenes]MCW6076604.1 DUF2326 domain-containing protein [Clostridium sporogenes]
MKLVKLNIYNLKEKVLLKEYKFNPIGVNIILGEKKAKDDETNGVGKTTMVDSIRYLLGTSIPGDFKESYELKCRDIFFTLKVHKDDKYIFLGRRVIDEDYGFYKLKEFSFDLEKWMKLKDEEYKLFIEKLVIGEKEDEGRPSFSSLREHIIRNEKNGFQDIIMLNRTAIKQYKNLAYLFELPYTFEYEINNVKKPMEDIKKQISIIKSMKKDIDELKIQGKKLDKEIIDLKKILSSMNISKKYNDAAEEYSELKIKLEKVQKEIFKNEHIKKQYNKNIENLKEKNKQIKEAISIKQFYEQILKYFPKDIEKNYDEINTFYEFMVDNRGKFFDKKINDIENILEKKYNEKRIILQELELKSRIFNNREMISDVTSISEEINDKVRELAEINAKISLYDSEKQLNKKINNIQQNVIRETNIRDDIYEGYKNHRKNIIDLFNTILYEVYKEQGILEFEYDNRISQKTTGRIKISCKIEDEKSHGRLHMKINMFDLTWFINGLNKNRDDITFLMHDGSYSYPDREVKIKLLKYIDEKLNEIKKGQYIITLNVNEINEDDLKWFIQNNNIVAKLDRSNNNSNRFFGFKYN